MKIQTIADRVAEPVNVTGPADVAPIIREMIGNDLEIKEYFVALSLNQASDVIAARIVSIGTVNQSLVHPREVFRPAIADNAAAVIIAHNHPSGTRTPSAQDNRVTNRLREAGQLLGIELLDHLIVTADDFYSYSDEGQL